jgi:hypothetical protein
MGPSLSPWQLFSSSPLARHTGIEHGGVNNGTIIQLSPLRSLYRSLLLALALRRFHVRLIGGFEAGFRRNASGFSTPSSFISLRRSLPTVSQSLPTESWLQNRL